MSGLVSGWLCVAGLSARLRRPIQLADVDRLSAVRQRHVAGLLARLAGADVLAVDDRQSTRFGAVRAADRTVARASV